MKKTLTITLSNTFFHISEDAYKVLKKYLDDLKVTFKGTLGEEEILTDIESRMAELFLEMKTHADYVLNKENILKVIEIMGQPEDYVNVEEPKKEKKSFKNKKLYRDPDGKYIGGVASGFSYYLGIDVFWIRLVLVLSLFVSFGTIMLIYIILWCLISEAKTATEKLEMEGEPINLSNIEKKIKESFEEVSHKIKNTNYKKAISDLKKNSNSIFSVIERVITLLFKVVIKLLGVLFVFISIIGLLSTFIVFISLLFSALFYIPSFIEIDFIPPHFPMWIVGIIIFFVTSIPLTFLLFIGLKFLNPKTNVISKGSRVILLIFWVLSIITIIVFIMYNLQLHNNFFFDI